MGRPCLIIKRSCRRVNPPPCPFSFSLRVSFSFSLRVSFRFCLSGVLRWAKISLAHFWGLGRCYVVAPSSPIVSQSFNFFLHFYFILFIYFAELRPDQIKSVDATQVGKIFWPVRENKKKYKYLHLFVCLCSQVRNITLTDFRNSLRAIRASLSPDSLRSYETWNRNFGSS